MLMNTGQPSSPNEDCFWFRKLLHSCILLAWMLGGSIGFAQESAFHIATFSADVTIPLNHRCMGVLPTKSQKIGDPLEAIGFVLLSEQQPVVSVAVDWCEIRNGAYDQWRDALATAAGTTRERVLVSSLHQHDAPVTDADAARLLKEVGLAGELYDETFHQVAIDRVVHAMTQSLKSPVPVTHLGTGQATVEQVASNRRVVMPDGRVRFSRGSRSRGNEFFASAPDGEIDPFLKTISFWNGETAVCALHVYATHPMSSYGQGIVSADFVGMARRRMQDAHPNIRQIYASGCSGDVTAGKYNDGSEADRQRLIERLYAAMERSWAATVREPLQTVEFRNALVKLPYYDHADLRRQTLLGTLNEESARTEDRILAAMGLASLDRVERGQPIDLPCVDFGTAQLVLFPGEAFVGYQLMAQEQSPDSFVVSVGYGECWPGYIPLNRHFAEGFHDKWLWVGPGSENALRSALRTLLR